MSNGDATTVHLPDSATVNIPIEIAESEPDNHDCTIAAVDPTRRHHNQCPHRGRRPRELFERLIDQHMGGEKLTRTNRDEVCYALDNPLLD